MSGIKVKEGLERLYARYSGILRFCMKLILGFLIYTSLRQQTGYMDRLNRPAVLAVLSLLCAVLPVNITILITSAVLFLHFYSLSWCALAVGGGVILILLLLYFGIASDCGYGFLLTPIALSLNMPMAAPVILGLSSSGSSLAGMLCGTAVYFVMKTVKDQEAVLRAAQETVSSASDIQKMISQGTALMEGIVTRREMLLTLITFCAVWIVVWVGRQMVIKYAWTVAITAGAFVYTVVTAVGSALLECRLNMGSFLINLVLSVILAMLVQLFLFSPDYRKIENVQFEDDSYYYYVRAIPKKKSRREIKEDAPREEQHRRRRENRADEETQLPIERM